MKVKTLTRLAFFSTILFCSQTLWATPSTPTPSTTSIYAVWADSEEAVYSQQEDLLLTPASTIKLITTYCALKEFGIDHRFETQFFTSAPADNGTIQDLWVVGEGDPSMVQERLWDAVQQLKALGITRVAGNIYVDDSFFDDNFFPGQDASNKRAYNAGTSALALNHNSVGIEIANIGDKLSITTNPSTPYFKIVNQVNRGGGRPKIYVRMEQDGDYEKVVVGGTYPFGNLRTAYYRSVYNTAQYFGNTLATFLRENGVDVDGKVLEGENQGKYALASYSSKPLSEIVSDVNKFSNNFMAEQLTKYLGAKVMGKPGTTEKGTLVLKNCLEELGIDPTEFVIENGSGLSYQSKISAKALVKILVAAYKDFKIRPDFMASLSVPGADGTMKRRQHKTEGYEQLRAKTGTLNGISSLAGYIPSADGSMIAFAILMNNVKGGAYQAHQLQDNFVLEWSQLKR